MQLLDKLITIQSIRESQPCLSSLLRHKQWFGNVPGCDRNLFGTTSSDLKGNVLFFLPCWRNIFPCNIPQMLLNICQHTIRFIIVFTSAKGQKGLMNTWGNSKKHPVLTWAFVKKGKKKKFLGKMPQHPVYWELRQFTENEIRQLLFIQCVELLPSTVLLCQPVYISHSLGSSRNIGLILRSQLGTTSMSNCLHKPLTVKR